MYNTEDILCYLSTQISVPQISPLSLNACGEPALVVLRLLSHSLSPPGSFLSQANNVLYLSMRIQSAPQASSVYNKGLGVEQLRL